jgi:hypothetical protein
VFYLNVAKLDLNVAYTCMLQAYVSSVFSCFKRMFQVFYLDMAYILQWLHTCFSGVSDVCCKCFSCFGRILQVFHLNVAKVDRVLHVLQWDPSAAAAGAPCMRVGSGRMERGAATGAGSGADGGKGSGSPRLCVEQGAGAGVGGSPVRATSM